MAYHTPLIATIVIGLGMAFICGALANRLRLFPLVGYLVAGVLIGPFTPGYVADQGLATQLAEIGVVLLMFGVGLHFSLSDLVSVRAIGAPLLFIPLSVLTSERPESRAVTVLPAVAASLDPASLTERGRLYVPAYSSIYAGGGAAQIELTVTLSLRNASATDVLLIERVDYLDTTGALVRQYFDEPRTLAPMGTAEIIIPDRDLRGGTGAKFLVDWAGRAASTGPVAEAVMIGLHGMHGLSFVSPARPARRSP